MGCLPATGPGCLFTAKKTNEQNMAFCRLRLKSDGLWRGPKDSEKKEQNKKKTVRSQIDIRREETEREGGKQRKRARKRMRNGME
jgi:hypothetical protein